MLFTLLIFAACETSKGNKLSSLTEIESEEAIFLQDDFALTVSTLPYRGAVLFIDYIGETDITDVIVSVDINQGGEVKQENMPIELVNNQLIAEIVDLMYIPGDELDVSLVIRSEQNRIEIYNYQLLFEGYYPWKDWMFDIQEQVFLLSDVDKTLSENEILQFVYGGTFRTFTPDGAHASWDFYTHERPANVYANTKGVFYTVTPDLQNADLTIYNPHTGAIVQFGHCYPLEKIKAGEEVIVGDHIANVQQKWSHVHYSVYRPYKYTNDPSKVVLGIDTYEFYPPAKWANYYWPIPYDDHGLYNDPFYWHEPTMLGYWYEETLPPGLKDNLLKVFKRDNPQLILPVKTPLN